MSDARLWPLVVAAAMKARNGLLTLSCADNLETVGTNFWSDAFWL
jgi:hypothetical protein